MTSGLRRAAVLTPQSTRPEAKNLKLGNYEKTLHALSADPRSKWDWVDPGRHREVKMICSKLATQCNCRPVIGKP